MSKATARLSVIFRNCGPDDMILAARAAKHGLTGMDTRDTILVYDTEHTTVATFYVAKRKSSIVVVKE